MGSRREQNFPTLFRVWNELPKFRTKPGFDTEPQLIPNSGYSTKDLKLLLGVETSACAHV